MAYPGRRCSTNPNRTSGVPLCLSSRLLPRRRGSRQDETLSYSAATLSVAGERSIALNPTYPDYRPWDDERFQGTHTLQLVDGGTGSADDLANVDARGKLVLMRPEYDWTCAVMRDQLQNALQAGAAGALIDPTQPSDINGVSCDLPMPPYWDWPDVYGSDHVDMPFAELKYQEAQTVRGLLSQGPVSIKVTDAGDPAYVYNLTDVETPTLKQYGLVGATIAVSSGKQTVAVTPGNSVETADVLLVRHHLEHLHSIGAVAFDELPEAYKKAKGSHGHAIPLPPPGEPFPGEKVKAKRRDT